MMDYRQKLIDIAFELVLTAHSWKDFQKKDREFIGAWVAKQLEMCGFPTHPVGSSWGALIDDPELLKKLKVINNEEEHNN